MSEHRGSSSKFYHGDALGSTRGITDSSQSVTDSQLYDAFGNTVSRTGTTPTPFGFVGKQQYQTDSDSGLQLLGHRYYDPSTGRFLSSDPAKAGTNWYAYCSNNPLVGTDPLGLFNWGRTIGGIGAGIAGSIIGGPVGTAVAVGIFEALYTYAETGDPSQAVGNGVISGGLTWIGGKAIGYVGSKALPKLLPIVPRPLLPYVPIGGLTATEGQQCTAVAENIIDRVGGEVGNIWPPWGEPGPLPPGSLGPIPGRGVPPPWGHHVVTLWPAGDPIVVLDPINHNFPIPINDYIPRMWPNGGVFAPTLPGGQ